MTELYPHDDFVEGIGFVFEKGTDFGGISVGANGSMQPFFGGSSSTWELRRFKLFYSQIENVDLSFNEEELKIYTGNIIYVLYVEDGKEFRDDIFKRLK